MVEKAQHVDWLPLRTVSRLTGLTPDLIRAWERRYRVVRPERGPRGARVYSLDDVRRLRLLAMAVQEGRAIGDVARLSEAELESLVAAKPVAGDVHVPLASESAVEVLPPARVQSELWDAVRAFDQLRLERVLGESLAIWPLRELVCQVIAPWIDEVGSAWSRGEISVAHEHFVSAALRNFLGQLLRTRATSGPPQVLFATPAGERHEFGLLLAALLVADRAVSAVYLGCDVPDADLLAAVQAVPVRVVAISVVDQENRARALTSLRKLLREEHGREFWLGGRDAPALSRQLRPQQTTVRCFARLEDLVSELDRRLAPAGSGRL